MLQPILRQDIRAVLRYPQLGSVLITRRFLSGREPPSERTDAEQSPPSKGSKRAKAKRTKQKEKAREDEEATIEFYNSAHGRRSLVKQVRLQSGVSQAMAKKLLDPTVPVDFDAESFQVVPGNARQRIEYAESGGVMCKSTRRCGGSFIPKGTLRYGMHYGYAVRWYHWGCLEPFMVSKLPKKNMKYLIGFDVLTKEDQEKVTRAIKQGHVDESDVYPKPKSKGILNDFYLQRREKIKEVHRAIEGSSDDLPGPLHKRLDFLKSPAFFRDFVRDRSGDSLLDTFGYAKSRLSTCDDQAKCGGESIHKNSLRYGIVFGDEAERWTKWWHWECLDPELISRLPTEARLLNGYESLSELDRSRVRLTIQQGYAIDPAIDRPVDSPQL